MLLRPPWRRLRNGLRQSGAEHDAPSDRLYGRQWQSSTARGGLVIQFTLAPHASWGTYDQDGQQINSDSVTNQWHYRRVDLTPFAGKTINWMWITADSQTLPGYYDMTFQDIALVSADGAVRRVFSRDKTIALTPFASSGVTGQAYSISHAAGVGWYPPVTTTYYHGDHLGSSRQMTNADGYPVWEATYLPYGQERAVAGSSASVNHYKFTGKERDGESNLDYFGARYYASAQARFLSVDPLLTTMRPERPQTLNRYAYVLNNPLRFVDPDGLYEEDVHRELTTVLAMAAGFDEKTAKEIGAANIDTDGPATGPYTLNKQQRKDYHFADAKRLGVMWDTFMTSGTTKDLGQYLHTLQDSYSHSEQIAKGETMHGLGVDKTYDNPEKADNMAKMTYQKLVVAGDRTGAKGKQVAWEKIDKHVKDFNKEKDPKKKQEILDKIKEEIKKSQEAQQQQQSKDKKAD